MENPLQYDVIIIGAGPAGLTAAIYAGRAQRSTLVLEKALPGGQLNETDYIENFPGFEEKIAGPELMGRVRKQAERFGAQITLEATEALSPIDGGYLVKGSNREYSARAVILASGSHPRELAVEGAKHLKGKGVSYCATCDGYFFQDKRLLEVGAGDSGLTEALFLTKFAKSVGIIVRHPEDDPHALRGSAILRRRAMEHPKIHFLWNRIVERVVGEDRVTGVVLKDLDDGGLEEVAADGLFINIGHVPETRYLEGVVSLDEHGYVITDERRQTSRPGVFAAGDLCVDTRRYAQAIVAAGDGAAAAIEAEKYLSS
jgi:thioredoxin reductase (NADPH)